MKASHLSLSRMGYAFAVTLALSACAANRTQAPTPEPAAIPAAAAPEPVVAQHAPVSSEPRPAATPGGYWPPKPIDENAVAAEPLPKMLTSDAIKLDAKRNPKAELTQRAIERWALLIAGQGEEAFEYLTPGYKKTQSKSKYAYDMAGRPVRWFRAAFDHVECSSEQSCEVSLLVDFRVRMTAGMGVTESFSFVKERWIAADGVWYHLPTEAGG